MNCKIMEQFLLLVVKPTNRVVVTHRSHEVVVEPQDLAHIAPVQFI